MSVYAKGSELLCERHYGDEHSWPDDQCPVCRAEAEVARLKRTIEVITPYGEQVTALVKERNDLKWQIEERTRERDVVVQQWPTLKADHLFQADRAEKAERELAGLQQRIKELEAERER